MPKTPRLREWRARAALSQEELRDLSGVSRATIADLEAGNRGAQPRTIRKLAEALGVGPEDLYGVSESPKVEAPPSPEQPSFYGLLEEELEEERRTAVVQLFDGLRRYLLDAADHWAREADTGGLLWSEDAAIVFSIEVNIEAARLYGLVAEYLEPALEDLLAGTLTLRNEQRKLVEGVERLTKAVAAANAAADAVAPPREPTDEEWEAAIPIFEQEWEEMDEVEQRRLLRECAEEMAEESKQAAAERRGRIA